MAEDRLQPCAVTGTGTAWAREGGSKGAVTGTGTAWAREGGSKGVSEEGMEGARE